MPTEIDAPVSPTEVSVSPDGQSPPHVRIWPVAVEPADPAANAGNSPASALSRLKSRVPLLACPAVPGAYVEENPKIKS